MKIIVTDSGKEIALKNMTLKQYMKLVFSEEAEKVLYLLYVDCRTREGKMTLQYLTDQGQVY
jgi:hypothetical protein